MPSKLHPQLVGCRKSLELTYAQLQAQGISPLANPKNLDIKDLPLKSTLQPGYPTAQSGAASFLWLTKATELLLKGRARALVTAPIAKQAWHAAGHHYPGQTERLKELVGADQASMLFTAVSPQNGWRFNTLLATTHIPLAAVPQAVSYTHLRAHET